MKFKAHKTGDVLKVYARDVMSKWLSNQPDGEFVLDLRTVARNDKRIETIAYFWVLIDAVETYTGYSRLEIYDLCCQDHMRFENEAGELEPHTLSQLSDDEMLTAIRRVELWMTQKIEMEIPQRIQGVST